MYSLSLYHHFGILVIMMKRDALIVSHFKLFLSNLRTVSSVSVYVSSVKIRASRQAVGDFGIRPTPLRIADSQILLTQPIP